MVSHLQEHLSLKDESLILLAEHISLEKNVNREAILQQFSPTSKARVDNGMFNKSLEDMRELVEAVIVDNITLTKKLQNAGIKP